MKSFQYLGFWLLLIFVVSGIYSVFDKNKVIGAFASHKSVSNNSDGVVEFIRASNGHFYIEAIINHKPIIFLVDTGASDLVLSKRDAKKLGISIKKSGKFKTYETANGTIRAAVVIIPEVKVGQFIIKNVEASINLADMQESLLGMSFLNYFNFSIKGDRIILYTRD